MKTLCGSGACSTQNFYWRYLLYMLICSYFKVFLLLLLFFFIIILHGQNCNSSHTHTILYKTYWNNQFFIYPCKFTSILIRSTLIGSMHISYVTHLNLKKVSWHWKVRSLHLWHYMHTTLKEGQHRFGRTRCRSLGGCLH